MTIDYYGDKDNYIHLKLGDCVKMYNFTPDFIKEYPDFVEGYTHYYDNGANNNANFNNKGFKSPFQVVAYVYQKKLPVHFYFNFTDEPAKSYDEIISYLVDEATFIPE